MNYPFILKISSVSNLSDARFAAGAWADFIGFNFDPASPDYMDPARAASVAAWVSGPLLCGEFSQQPPEWIADFVKAIPLQAVQIPASYDYPAVFSIPGVKFILEVEDSSQNRYFDKADVFLTHKPETALALSEVSDKPVILQTSDMNTDAACFDGIAFKGAHEEKPGTRNHSEWNAFLEKWESQ